MNKVMTKIIACNCNNEFQDKRYGKRKRVFNKTMKLNGTVYRCTVCKNERHIPS